MTNDLDRLLEQVVDALEDSGEGLWQPDLNALVLPALEQKSSQTEDITSQTEDRFLKQSATMDLTQTDGDGFGFLPAFSPFSADSLSIEGWETDRSTPAPGKNWTGQEVELGQETLPWTEPVWEGERTAAEQRSMETAKAETTAASPALLEQLQALEATQASAEALSRSQAIDSGRSSRSLPGQEGGVVRYDPASLGNVPMAAAAAAAQEEDRARAVDRAFQRDSRRYDRGFSLY